MSTNRIAAGTLLGGLNTPASASSRGSGTGTMPTLGSTVQNGKFAASAFADDSELKSVLLPTFGSPTMPQEKPMGPIIYIECAARAAAFRHSCRGWLHLRTSSDEVPWIA